MKGLIRFAIGTVIGAAVLLFGSTVTASAITFWQKGGQKAFATLLAVAPKAITLQGVMVSVVEAAVLYAVYALVRGRRSK